MERWLSYKGTCHVILLAKLHDMYLYKTATFPHQPVKSVSKVAFLHRFHCILNMLWRNVKRQHYFSLKKSTLSRAMNTLLTLSTLGKIFSRRHFETFSLFSQKTGFDISCKLSPKETICMKCQILFSGKNKKNIINLSSAENAQRVFYWTGAQSQK